MATDSDESLTLSIHSLIDPDDLPDEVLSSNNSNSGGEELSSLAQSVQREADNLSLSDDDIRPAGNPADTFVPQTESSFSNASKTVDYVEESSSANTDRSV